MLTVTQNEKKKKLGATLISDYTATVYVWFWNETWDL